MVANLQSPLSFLVGTDPPTVWTPDTLITVLHPVPHGTERAAATAVLERFLGPVVLAKAAEEHATRL